MSLALKKSSTAPRRHRGVPLPFGHVTTQQLKRDILAGLDYFYARRPWLHRPDAVSYLDLRKPKPAA